MRTLFRNTLLGLLVLMHEIFFMFATDMRDQVSFAAAGMTTQRTLERTLSSVRHDVPAKV